jgi:hypothetical protein
VLIRVTAQAVLYADLPMLILPDSPSGPGVLSVFCPDLSILLRVLLSESPSVYGRGPHHLPQIQKEMWKADL